MDTPPAALLFGSAANLWHLPPVLTRAGFAVDVVSVSAPYFRLPGGRRTTLREPHLAGVLRTAAALRAERGHDLLVASDDIVLRMLRDWDGVPLAERLALAPVIDLADMAQLDSKVAMTAFLDAAGVPVPAYRTASCPAAAIHAAEALGYPVLLKCESGSGGRGVRLVTAAHEVAPAWAALAASHHRREASLPSSVRKPMRVLVQEWVAGRDVDLSAVFRRGQLAHFTYSRVTEELNPLGTAAAREYLPTSEADPAARAALSRMGSGLGLHGFANIAARETPAGPVFFEVDARPTLWAHVGAAVGDDPATGLARAWGAGAVPDPGPAAAGTRRTVRMANRSSRRQLLGNVDSAVSAMPPGTADAALASTSADRPRLRAATGRTDRPLGGYWAHAGEPAGARAG